MGLAPYGEPKHVDLILDKIIDLKDDGSFRNLFWSGDRDEASAYFHGKSFPSPLRLPSLIMLEEFDEAVACLNEAIDINVNVARSIHWTYRYLCPTSVINAIEAHPGFRAALERMGIDDPWREELIEMVNGLEGITGIHIERDPPLT